MTKRNLSLLGAALVLATGLFWATVLTAPPLTKAAAISRLDPEQVTATPLSKTLPFFDDSYQRHLGVLDTLLK